MKGEKIMKKEFVMLSTDLKGKEPPKGWFVSTKLDGQRALWDGGVSRKYLTVPWSQDKDVPTGLWSRYGKVIHAPDWWIEKLPPIPLDGELYLGPQSWSELRSIVSRKVPDRRWEKVQYCVFDAPSPKSVWCDREYGDGKIVMNDCLKYYKDVERERCFGDTLNYYKEFINVDQRILDPKVTFDSLKEDEEGIMLRNPNSLWVPVRSRNSLKMKKERVSEGVVVGVTEGKGKYEGMVGALVVAWGGVKFQLSGMTDAERKRDDWAGKTVRFKYREVSNLGVPKEARYLG